MRRSPILAAWVTLSNTINCYIFRTMAEKQRSKKRRPSNAPSRAPWILGGIGIAALIVLPIVINAVQAAGLPGERFPSQGNRHVPLGANVPAYNSNPPTSGPHTDALAPWGSFLPGEAPPDLNLIHNMEDGGVILWYQPAGTPEESLARVAELERISAPYRRVVIAPREDMGSTFTFTAWQRLQRFDTVDAEGMTAFIEAYEGIDHHVR